MSTFTRLRKKPWLYLWMYANEVNPRKLQHAKRKYLFTYA
jgi:hypothetical protein